MAEFGRQFPEIGLILGMESFAANFDPLEYDIIIGTWPAADGFVSQKLRHEAWFPVAHPDLLAGQKLSDPGTLLTLPLYSSEKTEDWNLWMQHHQIQRPANLHIHQFELAILAVRAALGGRGVALSCGFMVEDLVKQGALVSLPEFSYELPWGHYSVHYRANHVLGDVIEKFVAWLLHEAKT